MLRKVLWIAAACAAVLVALAVSRSLNFDEPARPAQEAPAAVEVATPPPEPTPEPAPAPEAPPPLTPEDVQIQEDAAATGMTTVEPPPEASPQATPPY